MQHFITIFFILILSAVSCFAQQFEIRAINAGSGIISVEMRETSGATPSSSDFVTDLTFGLKWSIAYDVDLTNIDNAAGYNMVKSGGRIVKSGSHFQAFGANPALYNFPTNWTTNTWVEIMRIPNTLDGAVPTGTFQITETGFDATTDPNFGYNLTDFTPIINGQADNVILPVELKSFSAEPDEKDALLNWETETESNFSGFEVQHSSNNSSEKFEKIGWVQVKNFNDTGASYQYRDKSIRTNVNHYYRLKMIDLDGSIEFSPIRQVRISDDDSSIIIFPNPTADYLTIKGELTSNITLFLFDASGKEIFSKRFSNEFIQDDIDVSNLSSGSYYLKITNTNNQILYSENLIIN